MPEIKLLDLMLEHQDRLNSRIHPEWREQRFPWHRAIWMECAELMDCFPWKWWAKGETDWDNVKIELADLWHFILSWVLQTEMPLDEVEFHYQVAEANYKNPSFPGLPKLVDALAESALLEKPYTCCLIFFNLIFYCGLNLQNLAKIYFGKNTLNRFRQKHGLKEGRYTRLWNGVEDNKVMLRLIKDLEVLPLERFEAELTKRLEEAYAKAKHD